MLLKANEVNQALYSCLNDLRKTGASSRGDNFDDTVRDKLRNAFKQIKGVAFEYVNTDTFGNPDNEIYSKYKEKTSQYNFDFTGLPPPRSVHNGKNIDLLLVDKPNGSQKWPDMLIIYGKVGVPVEIKSSKDDRIVWNSGWPRVGGIYVFNCYGISRTTLFMGEYAITEEESSFLKKNADTCKDFNVKHEDGRWSFYVRNMFNSTQVFFEKKPLTPEETNFLKKIENADTISEKDKTKHSRLKEQQLSFLKVQENRIAAEEAVLEFVSNLKWDPSSQVTNFQ